MLTEYWSIQYVLIDIRLLTLDESDGVLIKTDNTDNN